MSIKEQNSKERFSGSGYYSEQYTEYNSYGGYGYAAGWSPGKGTGYFKPKNANLHPDAIDPFYGGLKYFKNVGQLSGAAIGAFLGSSFGPAGTFGGGIVGGYIGNKIYSYFDPLILDLGQDTNITLIGTNESTALFDMNIDGNVENTGWFSPEEGMLVIDKNNDGIINDLSEVFSENFSENIKNASGDRRKPSFLLNFSKKV